MKRLFLTMLGAALIVGPASAQVEGPTVQKVDVNKLKAAVAKSDAEIANPKKAAKAATWLKRGETFIDVDAKPVNGLYTGMPAMQLQVNYGKSTTPTKETVNGVAYDVYTYPHFKAYVLGEGAAAGVQVFVPVTVIDPEALDKAYDAFDKGYTIDNKTARRAGEGMKTVYIKSTENGVGQYALGNYKVAADNFRRAFRASEHPAVNLTDTVVIYHAGVSSYHAGDWNNALVDLDKSLELGFEDNGEAYLLKFLSLYNLDRKEEAIKVLDKGLTRFPDNEEILDMMMRYYADNDGDPSSLIPRVEAMITQNPTNPRLYQSLARVYDKLGQIDNAIETIHKAAILAPNDFFANYFEGYFIVKKADAMSEEVGKQPFTSSAQSQAAYNAVYDVYRRGVAPLEKAYSINPQEPSTVQMLKELTSRLREDPGMEEKYNKYNELFKALNQ